MRTTVEPYDPGPMDRVFLGLVFALSVVSGFLFVTDLALGNGWNSERLIIAWLAASVSAREYRDQKRGWR